MAIGTLPGPGEHGCHEPLYNVTPHVTSFDNRYRMQCCKCGQVWVSWGNGPWLSVKDYEEARTVVNPETLPRGGYF